MFCFFFFNDTATTEIYTLSLHDALPILVGHAPLPSRTTVAAEEEPVGGADGYEFDLFVSYNRTKNARRWVRRDRKSTRLNSSHAQYLVCRLLLEKKKNQIQTLYHTI